MKREFTEFFFYLSGLACVGLAVVGVFVVFGQLVYATCCEGSLFSSDSVFQVLGGHFWSPLVFAVIGFVLLGTAVKMRK